MTGLPSVTLVTAPWSRQFAAVEGSPLEGRATVTTHDREASPDEDAFDGALAGADALLVSPWVGARRDLPAFTEDRWSQAPNLKVIAGTFDHRFDGWLDVSDAARRGVAVIDTSRSMTPTVAEFALAMTLNLLRDIPAAIDLVRDGTWTRSTWDQDGFVHGDLTGRRVGLAGYGSINRRYAQLIAPFRCTVRACDPFVDRSLLLGADIEPIESLELLAAESEILVIGIPPTPATQGIISRRVIDALPRGSLMVLVTRMAVVEQAAMWARAEAGEIRVAVDVFDPEPPPSDASFRTSPHVLPTPHVASNTAYCHRRCFTTACADALAVLAGESPRYQASARDDRLYRGLLEISS